MTGEEFTKNVQPCNSCMHNTACAAWINHNKTIYDDFDFSVVDCPHFESVHTYNGAMFDKIAAFFEKPDNWRKMKECWVISGSSPDFRRLLLRAMEIDK